MCIARFAWSQLLAAESDDFQHPDGLFTDIDSLRTPRSIKLHQNRSIPNQNVKTAFIHLQDLAFRIWSSEAAHHNFLLLVGLEELTSGV